ncbi:MAG: DUF5666 domain-containing protein [Pseudomonadaceae bacterium]|nr:DUF5666 domain-containing protein [Pseudomonadaceae bacterium]
MKCTNLQLLIFFLGLGLAGCGGGGGGGSSTPATGGSPPPSTGGGGSNPPPANPDPGTGLARGSITGFGSVYINGKRFDTDNAEFIVDGRAATQDDLSVGMIVNVSGNLDDGVASVVRFDEDVKGPVDDIGTDRLTVFGQTVLIGATTVFDDNLSLASLQVGDVLEVSGLRDAADNLVASFLERKTNAVDKYEVTGFVRDLDTNANTFRIDGLVVDYSSAILDDLPGGLSNGALVEVEDEQLVYSPGAFSVLASKVEGKSLTAVRDDDDESGSDSSGDDNSSGSGDVTSGSRIEIEGLITELLGGDGFRLGGIEVRFSSSTIFEYSESGALQVGVKVEVYGVLDDSGVLQATKIEFSNNESRVAGTIAGIDLDAQTLNVFGVTVDVSSGAPIENDTDDGRGDSDDRLALSDLLVGDFVEVEGRANGNTILAGEIEVDELDRTELRGRVENVDGVARSLTILGIDIVTDGRTQYEGFNDEILTAEEFFTRLASDQTVVEAQWDDAVTDPMVAVHELSLED